MTFWGLVAGIVGGGLTALVAPWVKWIIERRRIERQERRELLASWRKGIQIAMALPLDEVSRQVPKEAWYLTLRSKLSEDARTIFEVTGRYRLVLVGSPYEGGLNVLLDEIDRIEKEWGLP